MMEIYEVLNQVHSEEEYMEFPEMETAACIRSCLRHRLRVVHPPVRNK